MPLWFWLGYCKKCQGRGPLVSVFEIPVTAKSGNRTPPLANPPRLLADPVSEFPGIRILECEHSPRTIYMFCFAIPGGGHA